jgi:glucose-1-phosphatase
MLHAKSRAGATGSSHHRAFGAPPPADPSKLVVCFDLGGVLARISSNWAQAMTGAGFDPPAEGRSNDLLSLFPLFDLYQAGRCELATYLRELGHYLGGLDAEESLAVHNAILIEPYADTLELVDELQAQGIRTGCLSNTNAPHWETMTAGTRFPAIAKLQYKLASHELKLHKPEEGIYRAFEAATGAAPADILFFEDSPQNVAGADLCGWRTHLIDPSGDTASQMRVALATLGVTV